MKNEPSIKEGHLGVQIALGSIIVLLVLCWMLMFMTVESALSDNGFRALRRDPGIDGLSYIVYLVPCYALLPVYVYLVWNFRSRVFRWVGVVAAGLGFVFWILHHLSHWHFGQRPTFSSHVVDLTLHAVGLWLVVNSIRWARFPTAVRDSVSVPGNPVLQQP